MIAIAQWVFWQHGRDNMPRIHQHVWITDGWEYAIVELLDYQKEQERDCHVTMKCFKWWVEPRPDIGI